MRHFITCTFAILAAFIFFGLSGFIKIPTPVPSSLPVPLIPQIADELCWAACTEMVSTYLNGIDPNAPALTQCQLFDSSGFGDCNINCNTIDTSMFPTACNKQSTPFPNLGNNLCFGYTKSTTTWDSNFIFHPFTWRVLDSMLTQVKMPIIFSWQWEGITIRTLNQSNWHYIVAIGAPHTRYSNRGWVSINDPWPVGKGRHSIIAYSEYANNIPAPTDSNVHTSVYFVHGMDYYDFKYVGK